MDASNTPNSAPPDLAIEVVDQQSALQVDPAWLARLARFTFRSERRGSAWLSIVLVADPAIHELNRKHLDHDWPTDVITFDVSDSDGECRGELIISTETAATEAEKRGRPPIEELGLYVVHGILHLCGYDDRDEASARRMADRQARLLSDFLAAPEA